MCEHLVNVGNFWMKQNHTVLSDQLQYWNRSPIFPGSWHYLFELASEAVYSLVLKMCFPTVILSQDNICKVPLLRTIMSVSWCSRTWRVDQSFSCICIASPLIKARAPAVKLCWWGKVEPLRNVLAFQFWFDKIEAMLSIYTALNTL